MSIPLPRRLIGVLIAPLIVAPGGLDARAIAAAPPDPIFTATLADGSTARGRLAAINVDGSYSLEQPEGGKRSIPSVELVKLAREGVELSLKPEGSVLLFPDGDRIHRASVGAANDTNVEVQAFSIPGSLSVPLESLVGVIFTLPQEVDSARALIRRAREEPRNSEVLWLANDDRLAIGFLGLGDKTIQYQSGDRKEAIDRSRVKALGFDPALAAYPAPEEGHVDLTLADGSRLGMVAPRLEQGQLVGQGRMGVILRVPLQEVLRIHPRSPSIVYLTEREPAAVRQVAYVGPARPVRRDETVEGRPFRLRGEEFDRGIGTQSRTLLAYRLKRGDRRFQATVGLDDAAGPLGSVVFKVRVDDREVFSTPPMVAGDQPRTIDVDLADASTLILQTEFGDRGGVRDLADWVEARIIR